MRLVPAALATVLLSTGCGLFTLEEPYERWSIAVTYKEEGGSVIATPESFEVNGPRGEIRVDNTTEEKRGFRIEGLGVATEIEDDESARLQITGVEDGKTYRFSDHLNRGGPGGIIRVRYVRQDQ